MMPRRAPCQATPANLLENVEFIAARMPCGNPNPGKSLTWIKLAGPIAL
jgi:hypothetical protein